MKAKYCIALTLLVLTMVGCKNDEKTGDEAMTNNEVVTIEVTQAPEQTYTPEPTKEPEVTEQVAESNVVEETTPKEVSLPSLTLIGHSSVKIKTKDGVVIYIDPYWPGDYEEEADIVLITHGHSDHYGMKLIDQKDTTKVIMYSDIHPSLEEYLSVEELGIKITSVPAYNKNHKKESCVGYLIEFDGLTVYHAGDTSMIEEMKDLTELSITYALYPTDGEYNMGAKEATEVANLIGAKVNISIHNNAISEEKLFEQFNPEGRLFIEYGATIALEP